MCRYITVVLLGTFGINFVLSMEEFRKLDDTTPVTLDHGLRTLQLDEDNPTQNTKRKTRYYQYYRVKKLHGKSDGFDEKQNVYGHLRKIPLQKPEKEFPYAENPATVKIFLSNETEISSVHEKGDSKTENVEGEYSDSIPHYKQQKLNEHIQNDKGKINFVSVYGKNYPEIYNFKRIHYYQPAGHEPKRTDNKQKIYIRKNKNFQYFKIVPGLSSKDKTVKKIDGEYNMYGNSNIKVPYIVEAANASNYKDDDDEPNIEESFDNDNSNVNDQNFISHNDEHQYEEKIKDEVPQLYDAGNPQINFYPTKTDNSRVNHIIQNTFTKGDKLNDTEQSTGHKLIGDNYYRYYGISKNTLYHNERNNRNTSKHGDIKLSYQHHPKPVLQKENRKSFESADTLNDYSVIKNDQLSPQEVEKKKSILNNILRDKLMSMEKKYKPQFDQKWYQNRYVKEKPVPIGKKSTVKQEFGTSTSISDDCRNRNDCNNYGSKTTASIEGIDKNDNEYRDRDPRNTSNECNDTKKCKVGKETNSFQNSNIMRNIYWPRKRAEHYRPNKQYFNVYDKNKAFTGSFIL